MADSGGFFTGSGKSPASIAKSSKRQGLDHIRSGKNISENTGQPEKAAVLHDERSRHFLRAEVFSDGQVPGPDGCGAYNPGYRRYQVRSLQDRSADRCCSVQPQAAASVPGLQTPDEDIRWWYSLERASGWDNPEDFPWKEEICPW